jgi:hypothetical protein
MSGNPCSISRHLAHYMVAPTACPLQTFTHSTLTLNLYPFRSEFDSFHLHTVRPLHVVYLSADHRQAALALHSVHVRPRDLREVLGEHRLTPGDAQGVKARQIERSPMLLGEVIREGTGVDGD